MRGVSVIGVGMIPFGKFPDRSLADLGWPAVQAAVKDAGIDPRLIEAAYCGTALGGMMAGQRILARIGLTGIPITNVENACSSSSTALRQGVMAIRSGEYDVVLVIGVEKLTKFGGGTLPLEDEDWEVSQGMVMPALYAMRANRYMHDFGLTREQLALVSVKNRRNGVLNPDAQMRKEVSVGEVLASRPVADPFTLLQCCPTGDGAAAVLICSSKIARRFRSDPVAVRASDLTSGRYTPGFRDMTIPEITVRGAHEAYEEAGLGPDDINLAEVHDAFSIAELLYYEAFGFCARGEAGARQVPGAKVGLSHATGGGISGFDHGACSIHIFSR